MSSYKHFFPLQGDYVVYRRLRGKIFDLFRELLFEKEDVSEYDYQKEDNVVFPSIIPDPFVMYTAIEAFDRVCKKVKMTEIDAYITSLACLYLSEQYHSSDKDYDRYSRFENVAKYAFEVQRKDIPKDFSFVRVILQTYSLLKYKLKKTIVDELNEKYPYFFNDSNYVVTATILSHIPEVCFPYRDNFPMVLETILYPPPNPSSETRATISHILLLLKEKNQKRRDKGDKKNSKFVDEIIKSIVEENGF